MLQAESIPDLHYVTYRMEVVYSPPTQLFLVRGRFTHKVPEFMLNKAAGKQSRMKLILCPLPQKKTKFQQRKWWLKWYMGQIQRDEVCELERDSAWDENTVVHEEEEMDTRMSNFTSTVSKKQDIITLM